MMNIASRFLRDAQYLQILTYKSVKYPLPHWGNSMKPIIVIADLIELVNEGRMQL